MSLDSPTETTSIKLRDVLIAFHAAYFPTLEVNMPYRFETDVENMQDPFIKVEIVYDTDPVGMPAKHCVTVSGQLVLNHYQRENSGEFIFNRYTDALIKRIGLETLEGITFKSVKPYPGAGRPGFDGVMNVIDFDIDYFNT